MQIKKVIKKDLQGNIIKIKEFNAAGFITYVKNKRGNEKWYSYDTNGNIICIKYSKLYDGIVRDNVYEYDSNNNCTLHKDNIKKINVVTLYNEQGKIESFNDGNTKTSFIKEYDENQNEIHVVYKDGSERWREYDENQHEVEYRDSKGLTVSREYHDNGVLYTYSDSQGLIRKYDNHGMQVYNMTIGGLSWTKKYDLLNRLVYHSDLHGTEKFIEYDEVTGKKSYYSTIQRSFGINEFGDKILKREKGEGFIRFIEYFEEQSSDLDTTIN